MTTDLLGRGGMFSRRFRSIPVSRELAVQESRLRYILSQGCKEGLVASPGDWPGPNCVEALLTGAPLRGTWFDRTAEYEARRRQKPPDLRTFATELELKLDVLPCWEHLPVEEAKEKLAAMVASIEAETAQRHRAEGTRPAGPAAVCRRHPHERPKKLDRSPAPLFHAFSRVVRNELFTDFLEFVTAYRKAAQRLRAGFRDAVFPVGSFPPPMPPELAWSARDGPREPSLSR